MRVTVFGASGRTGRELVQQGLARGHEITAFVRERSKLPLEHERLTVVEGDARDPDLVAKAVDGADGVISVLALMAPDREPEFSDATRTVVEAAKRGGVRKLVVTANNDVFGDAEVTGEFAAHAREHRRNRDLIRESGLDWTIGAAPWVTDDRRSGSYRAIVDEKAPAKRIAKADFATFALDAIERDDWVGHVVGVSEFS